jgi:hypothetical protein
VHQGTSGGVCATFLSRPEQRVERGAYNGKRNGSEGKRVGEGEGVVTQRRGGVFGREDAYGREGGERQRESRALQHAKSNDIVYSTFSDTKLHGCLCLCTQATATAAAAAAVGPWSHTYIRYNTHLR